MASTSPPSATTGAGAPPPEPPDAWHEPALRPVWELAGDPERLSAWRKLVLRRRPGGDGVWERLTLSPVALRRGAAVKCVIAAGPDERTETVPVDGWPAHLQALAMEGFDEVHLVADPAEWHGRRTKRGRWLVSRGKVTLAGGQSGPNASLPPHDRQRAYPLPPDHAEVIRLFAATGLFNPAGHLRAQQAAKYRQVQHYIDLLRSLPVWEEARRAGRPVRVLDAACGKAYLSLALSVYARLQGLTVELLGIDRNPAAAATVRRIAAELGEDRAEFVTGEIHHLLAAGAFEHRPVDLLVSLHACNTATDESLAAGVHLGAEAIVLAPCCHHELAEQLAGRSEATGESTGREGLRPVLRHGLLRGRFADLLTDGLRATALESVGYRAEVIEFVAAEHTAKNLMIRAVRRPPGADTETAARSARRAYHELTDEWQVRPSTPALLGDAWRS